MNTPSTLEELLRSARPDFAAVQGPALMLVILMIIDWITGVMAAIIVKIKDNRRVARAIADGKEAKPQAAGLTSGVGIDGLLRKGAMLLTIGAILVIDPLWPEVAVAKMFTVVFIGYEALSVIENAKACGGPVPDWLVAIVGTLKKSPRRVIVEKAEEPLPVELKRRGDKGDKGE